VTSPTVGSRPSESFVEFRDTRYHWAAVSIDAIESCEPRRPREELSRTRRRAGTDRISGGGHACHEFRDALRPGAIRLGGVLGW
jgi:hypothetical protein